MPDPFPNKLQKKITIAKNCQEIKLILIADKLQYKIAYQNETSSSPNN